RVPFESDSEFELLRAHLETAPVSPRARVPSVPDWLEAVILKAMAKDPAERFRDAASMAEALRRGRDAAVPPTRLAAAALPGPTTVLPPSPIPAQEAPAPSTTAAGAGWVPKLTAALLGLAALLVGVAFLLPEKPEPSQARSAAALGEAPGQPAAAVPTAPPPPEPLRVRIRSQESAGSESPEPADRPASEPTTTGRDSSSRPRAAPPRAAPPRAAPPKPVRRAETEPPKAAAQVAPPPPPPPEPEWTAERLAELGGLIDYLPKRMDQFHEEYDDLRDEVERRLGERREDEIHELVEDLEDAADDLRKLYRRRISRNGGGSEWDRDQVVREARRFESMARDLQASMRELQWGSSHPAWSALLDDVGNLRRLL
ncbi:MAG: hypothetical protein MI919_12800, partial [Holophagales bacterium]|nr:hypothetical protein [Holophagales bacterium]